MFSIEYASGVKKDLKKLSKEVLKIVDSAFEKISKNPYLVGEKLSGPLRNLFSYHIHTNKIDYRIIYEVLESDRIIFIIIVSTREICTIN